MSRRFQSALRRFLRGDEDGVTVIELVGVVAVLGIIVLIMMPRASCYLQKSRMASILNDLENARNAIELYEMEIGDFPLTLDDAFQGRNVPTTITYCLDDPDANKGHGNEECLFFDNDNPSGQNQHGGAPGAEYLLWTVENVAPCADFDYAWMTCCGDIPTYVSMDGDNEMPGHPKNKNK